MKKLVGMLLISVISVGIAFADAGSYDYSTNIFGGGGAGWYADTMALPSLSNGGQQSSYQNNGSNSGNNGYNYSDDNSGDYQNNDDSNCDCGEDY